jgi:orotidine-5'-phosphate decarboxylase
VLLFRDEISKSAKRRESNIVLALDLAEVNRDHLISKSFEILEETAPYICAVKLNRQLVLPLGLYGGADKIVNRIHDFGLPAIMDCKINDIGHTNLMIAAHYFDVGFDAVTASPFVGWEDGLQPVFELARQKGKGVILLVYMSHRGASEGYGQMVYISEGNRLSPQYEVFARKAKLWKADGAIVGATYPEKIKAIYKILKKDVPIYSPGIGSQGGDIKAAISAGATYLIIGRSIVNAENPAETAKELREIAWFHAK